MDRPKTGVKVQCPVSGLLIGQVKIPPHYIELMVCGNKHRSLFAYCQIHRTRVFVGDYVISDFLGSTIPNLEEGLNVKRG